MEDIFYNILWIDDEHESLGGTKGRAKRNGINLIPFKSLNGGMSELERNYQNYDGVLFDAKFYENEDDVPGTEDTTFVHRANDRLQRISKKFDVFVLTGQAEAYDDKTFKKAFPRVYRKGSDDEMERLFVDLKEAAEKQEDTQLRHSYKRVFDVCTEEYIGEYAGHDILNLLKVENEQNIDNHFNAIRKIVEDLFSAFHIFNLLPAEFVSPNVAINQSSIFLAGQEQKERTDAFYKQHRHLEETHLPPQIAYYIKSILAVTQSGSHRSNIDDHVRTVKTPFLLKSVFYQLLDVLVWFKMYVDSNPKTENWQKIETTIEYGGTESDEQVHGKVINVNKIKGYAFFKPDAIGENAYIHKSLVHAHSLQDGMSILAVIEKYEDQNSGEMKTKVKRIVII